MGTSVTDPGEVKDSVNEWAPRIPPMPCVHTIRCMPYERGDRHREQNQPKDRVHQHKCTRCPPVVPDDGMSRLDQQKEGEPERWQIRVVVGRMTDCGVVACGLTEHQVICANLLLASSPHIGGGVEAKADDCCGRSYHGGPMELGPRLGRDSFDSSSPSAADTPWRTSAHHPADQRVQERDRE
eukprot:scaffold163783_cov32-Tisochrysis_lutea.AAC.2